MVHSRSTKIDFSIYVHKSWMLLHSLIICAIMAFLMMHIPLPVMVLAEHNQNNVDNLSNNTLNSATNNSIPSAESVFKSQSITLPSSVKSFIWYIVNEAHENSANEKHKYISSQNPIFLPSNLIIPQGTSISFIDADAPWDTPHPHTINILDSSGKIVYTTNELSYTNSSPTTILKEGKYTIMDSKFKWMKGNITVSSDIESKGNLIVGGFYTPTNQVSNNKDNDGGSHPGWLGYYKTEFQKNGFNILSIFNFHYAQCKYCPDGYWPDQKTGDHTLLIYSTEDSLTNALSKMAKMIWNNVYI